jgi:hypothetical protein
MLIKDMALTPYGTASVIHMSTVKAMIPSMRCPATDRPEGVGAITIAAIISKLTMIMIGFLSNGFLPGAMLVAVVFCIVDSPAYSSTQINTEVSWRGHISSMASALYHP